MGTKIDLNGWWDWRVPGGTAEKKRVPSCYICVGEAMYSRTFELPDIAGKRVVLHFEGVHYTGEVKLNGSPIGGMLPYIFYDFDITGRARRGENSVEVTIRDITAEYGPTNGWEDYGGISRDVWVEITDEVFISDTQWITHMRDGYASADAELNVWIGSIAGREAGAGVGAGVDTVREAHVGAAAGTVAAVTATLSFNSHVVASSEASTPVPSGGTGKCTFKFDLGNVNAWSPAHPNLYSLAIEAACGGMSDKKEMEVGFREFVVKGESFYLNGEKTFLKGVARHDMWGDHQGFALTNGQIEDDLTMIKEMGANFVRLVHYPHCRHTIEYAAKIGLMLSEEPGIWQNDLADEKATGDALAILEKTILRDRSSPAVVAWLFFNECDMDAAGAYMKRGAELCRSLDPGRLLSGANDQPNLAAKQVFDEAGMDFYTKHPYCFDAEAIIKAADELRGKPLVLTEWGGWLIHFNPNHAKLFKKVISRLAHNPDDMPHINGMCWWEWQDIWQFSRGLPACVDGLLSDGLVGIERNRKQTYADMAEYFDLIERKPAPLFDIEEYPGIGAAVGKELVPLDLSAHYGRGNDKLWEEAVNGKKRHPKTPVYNMASGIMIHREIQSLSGLNCAIPAGRPLILRGERARIEAKVDANADANVDVNAGANADAKAGAKAGTKAGAKAETAVGEVFLFGAVSYFDGYPIRGAYGETAATITLAYGDGSSEQTPMRHGIEIASASLIARTSRLDARAVHAPRIAKITLDRDFEVFAVNMLRIKADKGKILKSVIVESADESFDPVVYAISVARA